MVFKWLTDPKTNIVSTGIATTFVERCEPRGHPTGMGQCRKLTFTTLNSVCSGFMVVRTSFHGILPAFVFLGFSGPRSLAWLRASESLLLLCRTCLQCGGVGQARGWTQVTGVSQIVWSTTAC